MIKKTSIFNTSLSALVVACAIAVISAPPAGAQTAKKLKCNGCVKSKQLKNNGIKGKDIKDGQVGGVDMKPDISLGTGGNAGGLSVKNTAGTPTVSLDGDSGNVTNLFSSTAALSNGLVKAWAQIAADGSIVACWRCNTDPAETQKTSTGTYEVDFTPLSTDISGRPRSAVVDSFGISSAVGFVKLQDRFMDASSVFVETIAGNSDFDLPFTVIVY